MSSNDFCEICDGELVPHIGAARDVHYRIGGHYEILRCKGCNLQILKKWRTLDILTIYDKISDYYAYSGPPGPSKITKIKDIWLRRRMGLSISHCKISNRVIATLLSPLLQRQYWWLPEQNTSIEKFIDVGCGSGKNVALMHSFGFESWGTDISLSASRNEKREGPNLVIGDFAEARLPLNHFDLVISDHAIEHMPDQIFVFSKLRSLLNDAGLAYISVPNTESLSARIFGRYWYFLGAPLHAVNYSPRTIRAVAAKVGLDVVEIQSEGNYQELLGSLQAFANRKTNKTSSQGLIWNSKLFRLLGFLWGLMMSYLGLGSNLKVVLRKNNGQESFGRN